MIIGGCVAETESGSRRRIPPTLIDIAIALAVVVSILIAMFIYTGIWPPLVVVESKSMQHSHDQSYIGTIDTGDLVLVKRIQDKFDITTYLEGVTEDYRSYGDYGDVIVYRRGGSDAYTPIIHRAVMFLEANEDGTFSAIELEHFYRGVDYDLVNNEDTWGRITGTIRLYNYGYTNEPLYIPVGDILNDMAMRGIEIHDGYITKGDYNQEVDQQLGMAQSREPVPIDWIVGKARGELPWFGIMKLWFTGTLPNDAPDNSIRNLWITIILIIAIPVVVEVFFWRRGRRPSEEEIQAIDQTKEMEQVAQSAEEALSALPAEDNTAEKKEANGQSEEEKSDSTSE